MPPQCRPPPALRWAQALSCCLAFSTAAAAGPWLPGEGDGCVAAWALSFGLTLLLGAAEASAGRFPPPRRDLLLAHAAAAAMACAAAAVIWPLGHLRGPRAAQGRAGALRATAAAASALAALCYGAEVLRDRARPGQAAAFLATPAGLLKVAEAFVALLLVGLAAEQGAGAGPDAWRWCLAVYGVSFALGVLLLGGCLGGLGCCGGGCAWAQEPATARRLLALHAALGVAAYAAAAVLWPLYAFRQELGGQPRRPPGCPPTCGWDRRVLVALLSAVNLLLFAVDLGQVGRLVLLRA